MQERKKYGKEKEERNDATQKETEIKKEKCNTIK